MKKEYDFTHATQGKFCVPMEEIEAPIHLEKDVAEFFHQKLKGKKQTLQAVVNELLRKDIEIAKRVLA
jgi:hypothetical protein